MKITKHFLAITAACTFLLAGSVTAMAASYESPADIVASLTKKPVEEIISQRFDSGKTYGTIAKEAGKLEEYKEEILNLKKDRLDEDVADGLLTQKEADQILDLIKERQTTCDGTGYNQGGCGYGRGMGRGQGRGRGACLYNN